MLTRLCLKMLICLVQVCALETIKENLSEHKPFGVLATESSRSRSMGFEASVAMAYGFGLYSRVY